MPSSDTDTIIYTLLCLSRWLFWVWVTSVQTTWWTCRWLICCRTGRASPGRATTGLNRALNPPLSLQASSHWCWCSAFLRRLSLRWRCMPSGTWSPLGRVMDSACLTTTDEMLCWPGYLFIHSFIHAFIHLFIHLFILFFCCCLNVKELRFLEQGIHISIWNLCY